MRSAPTEGRRAAILGQVGKLNTRPAMLLGQDVKVRELTARQSREFEDSLARGQAHPVGFLLQAALVDPDTDALLFEPGDRQALEELGVTALRPVLDIIKEQSGMTDADVQKAINRLKGIPANGSSS